MKVMIVGNGGREHALGYAVQKSENVDEIYFAPGNGGTSTIGKNIPIQVTEIEKLMDFALNNNIDLTIVGPETSLGLGIVDKFRKNGLRIFGPDKKAAQLECSKSFAKKFMDKYNIPTARYEVYETANEAYDSLDTWSLPLVIKADGLAAGKGVIICNDINEAKTGIKEIMEDLVFGDSGKKIIIEEYLTGKEVSLLCFTDGKSIVPMETAIDYKRIGDGGQGLNTGGMGSISPAFYYEKGLADDIALKTLHGIQKEKFDYKGVVYIGLMLTDNGPKVIEYNVRFGDPETEALMIRLETELIFIINFILDEKLDQIEINWHDKKAVCVVLSSKGYPEDYETGFLVEGLSDVNNVTVFHGGTVSSNGKIETSGGRVVMVCAMADTIENVRKIVYKEIEKIKFEGCYYRKDIGLMEEK